MSERHDNLNAELDSHLQMAIRDRMERGESAEQARASAMREFGNRGLVAEVTRETWGWAPVERLMQDLRLGLRILRRNPAFTVFAVLTLGLGIGANTAIFSVFHAILLRPLPYRDAGQLVMLWETGGKLPNSNQPMLSSVAPGNFIDWKARSKAIADMAAMRNSLVDVTGSGEPLQLTITYATANLGQVMGIEPQLGRWFTNDEDRPGGADVVVLSHRVWKDNYGADPLVLGKSIRLDNVPFTIIGVLPEAFRFPTDTEIWAPIRFTPSDAAERDAHFLQVVARMKRGQTMEQVVADLKGVAAQLAQAYPATDGNRTIVLITLRDTVAGNLRTALFVLLGAVGFILLIACANVANLLLARAASRQREIAVRVALGATRGRLIRQMLTESLLLAGAGACVGAVFAQWGFPLLARMIPASLPARNQAALSMETLAFTAAVAVITALLFGLVPTLRLTRLSSWLALRQGGQAALAHGPRGVVVISEVALAFMLLVSAGLMLQTLRRLNQVDLGFRPDHVLTLRTTLPRGNGSKYNDVAARTTFYRAVLAKVRALPGVMDAGYTTFTPMTNSGGFSAILQEGQVNDRANVREVIHRVVTPDYHSAMRIPLRAGRLLEESDDRDATPVALINETAARRYWTDGSPIGKRFRLLNSPMSSVWITIVGIVGDVHQADLDIPDRPEVYFSYAQPVASFGFYVPRDLVIRTANDPVTLSDAVRSEIRAVDHDQPVADVRPMEAIVASKMANRELQTALLAIFSGLALTLAAIGLYGVLVYSVTQRTAEIGIRMALGARTQDILFSVLGQGLRLAIGGVAVGAAGALVLAKLFQSLLYEVPVSDTATYAGVSLLMILVTIAACYLPANRASRVDPMTALRNE